MQAHCEWCELDSEYHAPKWSSGYIFPLIFCYAWEKDICFKVIRFCIHLAHCICAAVSFMSSPKLLFTQISRVAKWDIFQMFLICQKSTTVCPSLKGNSTSLSFKEKQLEKLRNTIFLISQNYLVSKPKTINQTRRIKLWWKFCASSTIIISMNYYKTSKNCSFCLTEFHFKQDWSANPMLSQQPIMFHIQVIGTIVDPRTHRSALFLQAASLVALE